MNGISERQHFKIYLGAFPQTSLVAPAFGDCMIHW